MHTLKQQYDGALNEIRVKEERINQLIREIHNLVYMKSTINIFLNFATLFHTHFSNIAWFCRVLGGEMRRS